MPPAAPRSEQVFLSYSRDDRVACLALRAALEQSGLSVFQDEDAIRIGDRWMTRLQEALQACSAFVLLVGRHGVERWVGAEVEVALSRHLSPHDDGQRLPIFPILLEDAKPEDLRPFSLCSSPRAGRPRMRCRRRCSKRSGRAPFASTSQKRSRAAPSSA